ncbi:uncharacterized protein CTRU02_204559 [Colletotrichum truncatum]|uniref:Uncharacterized protein n=1 Tax=Colletotrichum truncatum TaxID=5467 RepID=A0ACC3ZCF7_COLTU|nr:uncharacterized protein CTRU02_02789 [Colletotrichum truncatum]KAF6797747.1 hypothetical protein CTRU02_02789 [Colletotrichum truncatum]
MTKAWKEHRDVITNLYINENRTLDDVRDIMQKNYNFRASTRSYRQQFDKWSLSKYNCKKRNNRRQQHGPSTGGSPSQMGMSAPSEYGSLSPQSFQSQSPDLDHTHDALEAETMDLSHSGPVGFARHYTYLNQAQPSAQASMDRHHWEQQERWRAMSSSSAAGLPSPPDDNGVFFQMETQSNNMELISPQPVHPQQSYSVLHQNVKYTQPPGGMVMTSGHRYAPYNNAVHCAFRTSDSGAYRR